MRRSLSLKIITFILSCIAFFYAAFLAVSYFSADYRPLTEHSYGSGSFQVEDSASSNSYDIFNNRKNNPDPRLPGSELKKKGAEAPLPENQQSVSEPTPAELNFLESPAGSFLWIVLAFFIILSGFIYQAISLGWQKNADRPSFMIIHLLPLDLMTVITGLLIYSIAALGYSLGSVLSVYQSMAFPNLQLFYALFWTVDFIIFYGLLLTFVAQIKSKTLFTSGLLYRFLRFCTKALKKFLHTAKLFFIKLPLVYRELLIMIIYFLLNAFLIYRLISAKTSAVRILMIVLLVLINAAVIFLVLRFCIHYQKIKKTVIALSEGRPVDSVDAENISSDFYEISKAVNQLKSGIDKAIEEKNKSNLFKTELITNVSHDIKTPLTSIIMYADLLSREEINNENASQYIAVITKQSNRLKKLIEDLIEASKISTGNIAANLIPLDIKEFLSQIYADYTDKFAEQNLKLVLTFPETSPKILADPKYLIRVFENLFQNIQKYALPDTRVYIDVLAQKKDKIGIRIRNVSADTLHVSSEQLLERFVQGDTSRSKGGSGIGLSIAKSLMEAQQGSLRLDVENDLFTVDLTLKRFNEQSNL